MTAGSGSPLLPKPRGRSRFESGCQAYLIRCPPLQFCRVNQACHGATQPGRGGTNVGLCHPVIPPGLSMTSVISPQLSASNH